MQRLTLMYLNIISRRKGGGAELLVHELHKIYLEQTLDSHAIYFVGKKNNLEKNEIIFGRNLRNPLNILRIRKILRDFSTKSPSNLIVHAHLTWPFIYTILASLGLKNIKFVYTEHSTTNKRRKIPLLWIFERMFYSRYNNIICISQGVHDSLAEWLGPKLSQRLITIPNGSRIYSLAKRPTLEGRLPNLVSVGSLSSRKNFSTAIYAIAKLKNEINSYTIIGEGPERNQLEQIINNEGLTDKVKLIGWSDNIEEQLQCADIQLIPSLWEGFGLVAVEGMSTGLPVIASNVSGLREVLGENNEAITLVNEVESKDAWASAIREKIKKIKYVGAESLAISSRTQAENFTLDKMANKYLQVYNQLLDHPKQPDQQVR